MEKNLRKKIKEDAINSFRTDFFYQTNLTEQYIALLFHQNSELKAILQYNEDIMKIYHEVAQENKKVKNE